jgi:hypothetical protein
MDQRTRALTRDPPENPAQNTTSIGLDKHKSIDLSRYRPILEIVQVDRT